MKSSKLGNYITLNNERNTDLEYTKPNVKGVSINKIFIETKANLKNVSLKPYKVIKPRFFAYVTVTSRNGEKISLAYNDSQETYLVSSSYVSFYVTDETKLLPEYLYIYFNRPEFDRIARFNSWGSARETFAWEDLCDIEIELPPLKIQQKYVNLYNSLKENQIVYESGLDELEIIYKTHIDKIKNDNLVKIGKLLRLNNKLNSELEVPFKNLRGINQHNEFSSTRTSIKEKDMYRYKIVEIGEFAFNFMALGNWGKFYFAYNDTKKRLLLSSATQTAALKTDKVLPEYLLMLFSRDEFQRKCVFLGDGNTRGGISWELFKDIKVPIPTKEIQQSIVNIFKSYLIRKDIGGQIKQLTTEICPILIKGAIEESKGVI